MDIANKAKACHNWQTFNLNYIHKCTWATLAGSWPARTKIREAQKSVQNTQKIHPYGGLNSGLWSDHVMKIQYANHYTMRVILLFLISSIASLKRWVDNCRWERLLASSKLGRPLLLTNKNGGNCWLELLTCLASDIDPVCSKCEAIILTFLSAWFGGLSQHITWIPSPSTEFNF